MTVADLRELHRYPDVLTAITDCQSDRVELDLGKLAYDNPFALTEAVLLARTLGLTLVSVPAKSAHSSRPKPSL